ncbi:hypothetical protein EJ08DRAFT_697920 [Tothia fuscella]|uniref:Myb-like domain-containing protein n=1 Tax=Tothia fuscella TaxID=1048955 RepID=A0A9P4TYH2_9PEZI|nr:hypothetical protein EJ08DRAFT_697920 [Tothia fuscella]
MDGDDYPDPSDQLLAELSQLTQPDLPQPKPKQRKRRRPTDAAIYDIPDDTEEDIPQSSGIVESSKRQKISTPVKKVTEKPNSLKILAQKAIERSSAAEIEDVTSSDGPATRRRSSQDQVQQIQAQEQQEQEQRRARPNESRQLQERSAFETPQAVNKPIRSILSSSQQVQTPLLSSATPGAKWTENEDRVLLQLKRQGHSIVEIAERLPGRNSEGVRKRLQRVDVQSKPSSSDAKQPSSVAKRPSLGASSGEKWTENEDRVLCQLKEQGHSNVEIAEHLPGRNFGAIRKRLQRLKIQPSARTPIQTPARALAVATVAAPRPHSSASEVQTMAQTARNMSSAAKWSEAEDSILLRELENGNTLKQIAIQHLSSRSADALRKRQKRLEAMSSRASVGSDAFFAVTDDPIQSTITQEEPAVDHASSPKRNGRSSSPQVLIPHATSAAPGRNIARTSRRRSQSITAEGGTNRKLKRSHSNISPTEVALPESPLGDHSQQQLKIEQTGRVRLRPNPRASQASVASQSQDGTPAENDEAYHSQSSPTKERHDEGEERAKSQASGEDNAMAGLLGNAKKGAVSNAHGKPPETTPVDFSRGPISDDSDEDMDDAILEPSQDLPSSPPDGMDLSRSTLSPVRKPILPAKAANASKLAAKLKNTMSTYGAAHRASTTPAPPPPPGTRFTFFSAAPKNVPDDNEDESSSSDSDSDSEEEDKTTARKAGVAKRIASPIKKPAATSAAKSGEVQKNQSSAQDTARNQTSQTRAIRSRATTTPTVKAPKAKASATQVSSEVISISSESESDGDSNAESESEKVEGSALAQEQNEPNSSSKNALPEVPPPIASHAIPEQADDARPQVPEKTVNTSVAEPKAASPPVTIKAAAAAAPPAARSYIPLFLPSRKRLEEVGSEDESSSSSSSDEETAPQKSNTVMRSSPRKSPRAITNAQVNRENDYSKTRQSSDNESGNDANEDAEMEPIFPIKAAIIKQVEVKATAQEDHSDDESDDDANERAEIRPMFPIKRSAPVQPDNETPGAGNESEESDWAGIVDKASVTTSPANLRAVSESRSSADHFSSGSESEDRTTGDEDESVSEEEGTSAEEEEEDSPVQSKRYAVKEKYFDDSASETGDDSGSDDQEDESGAEIPSSMRQVAIGMDSNSDSESDDSQDSPKHMAFKTHPMKISMPLPQQVMKASQAPKQTSSIPAKKNIDRFTSHAAPQSQVSDFQPAQARLKPYIKERYFDSDDEEEDYVYSEVSTSIQPISTNSLPQVDIGVVESDSSSSDEEMTDAPSSAAPAVISQKPPNPVAVEAESVESSSSESDEEMTGAPPSATPGTINQNPLAPAVAKAESEDSTSESSDSQSSGSSESSSDEESDKESDEEDVEMSDGEQPIPAVAAPPPPAVKPLLPARKTTVRATPAATKPRTFPAASPLPPAPKTSKPATSTSSKQSTPAVIPQPPTVDFDDYTRTVMLGAKNSMANLFNWFGS